MATQYQKRMMVRKNSDLTRLSQQFGKDIGASTSAYEKAFGDYQKQRDELMAPYDTAVKNYQDVLYPEYEQATSNYKTKLDQFKISLGQYEANPTERVQNQKYIGGRTKTIIIDGKQYYGSDFKGPADISLKEENKQLVAYRDKAIPTFSDKLPSAPSKPEAPVIAPFDDSSFKNQSQGLQAGFSRDLGARKAARLNVIGRKSSRPLMGGM
jgi:hypothetical protein